MILYIFFFASYSKHTTQVNQVMSGFNNKTAIKYASVGGVSGLAFHQMYSSLGTSIKVKGITMPLWVFGAGMGITASFLSDVAHEAVLGHISSNEKVKHVESTLLQVAVGAGAFVMASELLSPGLVSEVGWQGLASQGALINIAAEFAYQNLTVPIIYDEEEIAF